MKKTIKKIALASVLATMAMPSFAGVVEHELEAGDSAVTELVFVAKTNKQAIIRLGQPGIADDLRDGAIDTAPDETYGFAFGQPSTGTDPNPWENYVINTVGTLNGSLQDEICGAAANATDLQQISQATASQTFVPEVASTSTAIGANTTHDLSGACSVDETDPAEATVTANVKLAYEVLVAGGATMDMDVLEDNGIQSDLITDDATMEFTTFSITQSHYGADGLTTAKNLLVGTESMAHGDNGVLAFDIGFEASGANAKAERRASVLITAAVPL